MNSAPKYPNAHMKFDVLLRLLNEASEPTRLLSEMAIFKCMPASNTHRILLNNQEKLARPSDRHGCLLTNEQVVPTVSQGTISCKQPIADHSYLLWQCLARHTCCPMKDSPAGPVSLPWRRDTISYWRRKYHKADLHSLLFLFFSVSETFHAFSQDSYCLTSHLHWVSFMYRRVHC